MSNKAYLGKPSNFEGRLFVFSLLLARQSLIVENWAFVINGPDFVERLGGNCFLKMTISREELFQRRRNISSKMERESSSLLNDAACFLHSLPIGAKTFPWAFYWLDFAKLFLSQDQGHYYYDMYWAWTLLCCALGVGT